MVDKALKNMNLGELRAQATDRGLVYDEKDTRAQIREAIETLDSGTETADEINDELRALAQAWSDVDAVDLMAALEPPDDAPSPPESHSEPEEIPARVSVRERALSLGIFVAETWTDEQTEAAVDAYTQALADAAAAPRYVPSRQEEAHAGYERELASPRG